MQRQPTTPRGSVQPVLAEHLPAHLPSRARALMSPVEDVHVQLFSHEQQTESLTIPAVAEPLLVLVLNGAARVEERDPGKQWRRYHVRANDLFITHSLTPYEMRWRMERGHSFEVMHVYLGQRLFQRAAKECWGAVRHRDIRLRDVSGAHDPLLASTLRLLLQELDRADHAAPSRLFVESLSQLIAVHLLREHADQASDGAGVHRLQAHKLAKVIRFMEDHLGETVTLDDLANVAQLSRYHFSRTFVRALGVTPMQHLAALRLSEARRLLASTDLAVEDIARLVGHASASHFAQRFRAVMGVSPRAFRLMAG